MPAYPHNTLLGTDSLLYAFHRQTARPPPGGGEAMDVEEGGSEAGPITSARGYPHGAISVLSLDDGASGSGR